MRALSRSLFPLLVVLALASCARRGAANAPMEPTTLVRVENQSFSDMTIYVIEGSQRIRLGIATGSQTTTFTIPKYLMHGPRSLRFLADPIGATRTPVSDEITVIPGDQVTLTIPPT